MIDTGYVAKALLENMLLPVQAIMQDVMDTDELSFLITFAALHDIGKCDPAFEEQGKAAVVAELQGLGLISWLDKARNRSYRHEIGSMVILERIFDEQLSIRDADDYLKAIALHHQRKGEDREKVYPISKVWHQMQDELFQSICQIFQPKWEKLSNCSHKDAACILLWGLIVLSDWLASGSEVILNLNEQLPMEEYCVQAEKAAKEAVCQSGLEAEMRIEGKSFTELFPEIPPDGMRPLQTACQKLCEEYQKNNRYPGMILLESAMGDGKTEAAFTFASTLMKGWAKNGFYMALPTSATSNNMYGRVKKMLSNMGVSSLRLLHGQAWAVQKEATGENDTRAWLAPARRALLSQYGVGTVDQVMLAVLKVKYTVLRLVGMADKVLIIDEIHAYDAYMQQIIIDLLAWCCALRIPVIMLSATLTTEKRKAFAEAFGGKITACSQAYPLITQCFADGETVQTPVNGTYVHQEVSVNCLALMEDLDALAAYALEQSRNGGCMGIIVNTVQEAQQLFSILSDKREKDLTLYLYHARYLLKERRTHEMQCVNAFGKEGIRPKRAILIATQVVEQSIDLDLDRLITMLCPMDLLLQRIGRMHRHRIHDCLRPLAFAAPQVTVVVPKNDILKTKSACVYAPWILTQTLQALQSAPVIHIPEDIRSLVEKVYTAKAEGNDYRDWAEMVFSDACKREAGKAASFPMPNPSYFFATEQADEVYRDDEEQTLQQNVGTRFGNESIRVAFVPPDWVDYSEKCTREQAEDVLMRTATLSRRWFKNDKDYTAHQGQGLLKGIYLLPTIDERYKNIIIDPLLGIVKEEEN